MILGPVKKLVNFFDKTPRNFVKKIIKNRCEKSVNGSFFPCVKLANQGTLFESFGCEKIAAG